MHHTIDKIPDIKDSKHSWQKKHLENQTGTPNSFKPVKIKKNEIINVFNKGKHKRSFTYIDDAINNLYLILKNSNKINTQKTPVLNIGNPNTVTLTKFISILEKKLFKKSKKKYLKRQPGDVLETKAIINFEKKKLKFLFKTELEEGINKFVNWHNKYHK